MVKKLVIKVTLMVVVMVGVSNYAVYLMTGKSPFSTANMSVPDLSIPKLSAPKLPRGKDTAYKWIDENGVVHYSTEPPVGHQQALQKMEVDPNQNLIQGITPKPEEQAQTATTPAPTIQSPYTPEGAQKLINDAKNVQKLLDDRYEKQRKIIDSH